MVGVQVTEKHINIVVEKKETPLHFGKYSQKGDKGDKGNTGDKGDPGDIALQSYTHNQNSASTHWVVVHNLGYIPSQERIIDSANEECFGGNRENETINGFTKVWPAAFSGTLTVS